MSNAPCRVDFRLADRPTVARLERFLHRLRHAKAASEPAEEVDWVGLLTDAELRRLRWSSAQEAIHPSWHEWRRRWLPNEERYERDLVSAPEEPGRVAPGWDLLSLTEALLAGDYEVRELDAKAGDIYALPFEPWGWPYGGVCALISLVETFGGYVIGWDAGDGPYETRRPGACV